MDRIFLISFISSFIIFFLFRAFKRPSITKNGRPLRNPPNTLPIVGNGIVFLQPREKLFKWFTQCIEQYGHETLGISVPSLPPGVIISDPANLEYVFKHDSIFEKGDFFKDRLKDLFGSGIVNVDGELWKRQRKAGSQFLSTAHLKLLSEIELPRIIEAAMDDLELKANRRTVVDLEEVIHEITTRLMGKMAYGMEMHASDEFTAAFDYASAVTARRFQNPLWFLTELVSGWRLRKAMRTVQAFGRRIVAENISTRTPNEKADMETGGQIPRNLIYTLFQNLGNEALVADSALNFLSAGKDTVAQALTWTMYLFMKHPAAVKNLLQKVSESGDVSPSTTAHSHVLAAFYESLRLYPPIPFEIKQAQESTTLPDGTILPQGTIVVWCTWAMNRSRELWGDDALDYRPERWLRDGKFTPRSAAEFPVFQGGSRLCLGKKMAELIAVQVITTIIGRFDLVPAFEGEKTSVTHLTLPIKGGLHAYVKLRDCGHTHLSNI